MTAPRMRAGTSDRQAAVEGLTQHFTEGRLDTGEFDERVGTAYAATYLDELPALFADLPAAGPGRAAGSDVRRSEPEEVIRFSPSPAGLWPGPSRLPLHRPQRILAALAGLVFVLFLISLLTHGIFLFPLGWVAFFFIFNGGGRHRVTPPARETTRW